MSSRNKYLSPDQRRRAPALYRSLQVGESLIRSGEPTVEVIRHAMLQELMTAGFAPIDYIAIVDPESLQEVVAVRLPVALLVAARLGATRLIDNVIVANSQLRKRT
jgi:pantoate--beta-alanine ligase